MSVLGNWMSSKIYFVIKSVKNVFFVLTFVTIFLKLIIAQLTVYAHFKDFFCAIIMRVTKKLPVQVGE